ncbi:TetR/AcrR family transcriptional regulator [Phenylobacterium sp. LH3H17]|uniref:TetR/AcrR family transcriptional regulator n=1 Tax=Phenylobacterium sp. LH3H17 TaxID=2903901 RepID=UPI0020C9C104|nr:TetR/AcrR family transcriptional regulator [Phenylobacterium sp. LH3H17]UTP38605.1 TetR/AcrR family transcriptional regulator [Phenylobacterium sp. LH3H17]
MIATGERVDRRRERTRAALMRAGQVLFATRSVDAVSIDDIVAAAEVAKGSFYNHFPDKDGLAREIAKQARAAIELTVADINAGVADPAERVARALAMFARGAEAFPIRAQAMMRLFPFASVPDAPMNRGVRADIQAGLAAGRFEGLAPEAAVLMAVGTAQIAVSRVLERHAADTAATLAEDLIFGLLRGLGLDTVAARTVAGKACADIFAATLPSGL